MHALMYGITQNIRQLDLGEVKNNPTGTLADQDT
jgi:hypothetical protein